MWRRDPTPVRLLFAMYVGVWTFVAWVATHVPLVVGAVLFLVTAVATAVSVIWLNRRARERLRRPRFGRR